MARKTQQPQIGDSVLYFGNSRDAEARPDGEPFEPREALVEAVAENGLTLRVHVLAAPEPARFSDDPERFVIRRGVPHRADAPADHEGTGESSSYWDFAPSGAQA